MSVKFPAKQDLIVAGRAEVDDDWPDPILLDHYILVLDVVVGHILIMQIGHGTDDLYSINKYAVCMHGSLRSTCIYLCMCGCVFLVGVYVVQRQGPD